MRAKTVYEFVRGRDPKESLGLGLKSVIKIEFEKLLLHATNLKMEDNYLYFRTYNPDLFTSHDNLLYTIYNFPPNIKLNKYIDKFYQRRITIIKGINTHFGCIYKVSIKPEYVDIFKQIINEI